MIDVVRCSQPSTGIIPKDFYDFITINKERDEKFAERYNRYLTEGK